MDRSAIEAIQQAVMWSDLNRIAGDSATLPMVLAPKDTTALSLERFNEHASRYRMQVATPSLNSFVEYVKAYASSATAVCFVDPGNMEALCILDAGDVDNPGHQEHTISLQPQKTAFFRALCEASGIALSQRDAAEFLEDWGAFLFDVGSASGENMTPANAVQGLRTLTIETARKVESSVQNFSASASAMERVEATNLPRIPARLNFSSAPYQDMSERHFAVGVRLLTGEDRPRVVFRIEREEQILQEIADEISGIIDSRLADYVSVYIGRRVAKGT